MDIIEENKTDELAVLFEADTTHYTCCRDDNTTLCKAELDNFEPVNENDIPCNVCDFLVETQFCPKGLICPTEEQNE